MSSPAKQERFTPAMKSMMFGRLFARLDQQNDPEHKFARLVEVLVGASVELERTRQGGAVTDVENEVNELLSDLSLGKFL